MIDLRSDTVTRPTAAMRQAMAEAEVGDDAYGDDPTARRLEERAAAVLGKEASLFVPSGTMANQIALLLHCRPGDEVILGEGSHIAYYEGGAGAAWAGVQFVQAGAGGVFTAREMSAAIKPRAYYLPRTRTVAIENTHNRAGGRVFPQQDVVGVAKRAHELGLAVHLDGARIWNAAVATGMAPAELAAPADTVTACFSKGLGAPVGSVFAGTRMQVEEARRLRRMLGGGMRQVGVLCAAALHALDYHVERIAEDHANARRLAEGLGDLPGLECDPSAVQTNIVLCNVREGAADRFATRLAERAVRVNPVGLQALRAVTHLDVDREAIDRAIEVFAEVARA
ncbi:MAG: GntG family PLP-dependent aldolase [Myxococcota bacterium]